MTVEQTTYAEFIRAGHKSAYDEVLTLLDAEIIRHRESGDQTGTEYIEALRAKIEAKGKR